MGVGVSRFLAVPLPDLLLVRLDPSLPLDAQFAYVMQEDGELRCLLQDATFPTKLAFKAGSYVLHLFPHAAIFKRSAIYLCDVILIGFQTVSEAAALAPFLLHWQLEPLA